MHDVLLTWGMIEPFLRQTSAWGQRYSVMARALEACRSATSQQLGVAPHAVHFHIVMPWRVATGQQLTAFSAFDFESILTGVAVPVTLLSARLPLACHLFSACEA